MQALVDENDQSVKEMLNVCIMVMYVSDVNNVSILISILQHLPAECAQCIPLVVFEKLTWPTQQSLRTTDTVSCIVCTHSSSI